MHKEKKCFMNLLDKSELVSEELVNNYIITNSKFYESTAIPYLRSEMLKMTYPQFQAMQMTEKKDPIILLLVSLLAGTFGIDRFLLGQVGLGVVKLITCGGFGIWTIIDWILIMGEAKKKNLESFNQIVFFNRPVS